MKSNRDQLTKTLEDKVEAQKAPLEAQLSTQLELIKIGIDSLGLDWALNSQASQHLDLSKLRTAGPISKSDKQE